MFNPQSKSSETAQSLVQKTVKSQLKGDRQIYGILSYLLGELVDNITDHSGSNDGYLYCQSLRKENSLYVFICDTGRSIYSSYATDERYSEMLTEKESSAIALAINGKSTKNRPENENRGFGISKSREIIVNGLGGEFLLLSGSAFFRHDRKGESIADLPEDIRWNGTMVLMKLPTAIPAKFNIYDYI